MAWKTLNKYIRAQRAKEVFPQIWIIKVAGDYIFVDGDNLPLPSPNFKSYDEAAKYRTKALDRASK